MPNSKINSRKGQVRITETISVLLIFFMIIVFAMIFYGNYQKTVLEENEQEAFAEKAIRITTKLLSLPELACTKGDSDYESFCFDMLKLRHANKLFKENLADYYYDLFSYSRVTVYQTYPFIDHDNPSNQLDVSDNGPWVLYEKMLCPEGCKWEKNENKCVKVDPVVKISCRSEKKSTYFVVSLRDDTKGVPGKPEFKTGYIHVEVFK